MMAHRDIHKMMVKIDDENKLSEIIIKSTEKLVVIDLHQDWCGVCEALHPTFLRLFTEIDDCDSKLMLASASIKTLCVQLQLLLPSDSTTVKLDTCGCQPMFLILKDKKSIGFIVGADAPQLIKKIMDNINVKSEETSQQ